MPNFKIIQDVASNAKVQIYGSGPAPLQTDTNGNLGIYSGTGLSVYSSDGLSVYSPTGLSVYSSTGLSVYSNAGLSVYSNDGLSVFSPTGLSVYSSTGLSVSSTGLSVYSSTGLSVYSNAGLSVYSNDGLSVYSPTGLSVYGPATGITVISGTTSISEIAPASATGAYSSSFNTLGFDTWTIGVYNPSGTATVTLETGPDNSVWMVDSTLPTLGVGLYHFVASYFFKYARVNYSGSALTFWFQGR